MILPTEATSEYAKSRFSNLASIVGGDIALYCMCAVYNLPVDPSASVPTWSAYIDVLRRKPGIEGFADGETDVEVVIANGASEMDRWQAEWGEGDPDNPYTAKDYKNLDSIFRTYSARLDAAGGMDAQQEDTLRHCSRMALLRDKSIASGDKESIDIAAKLDKMIQDNLSAENLRKKDAKPIETARVDGIIDALTKKYGVGVEMTKDQFLERVFFPWCKNKRYPETVDAAEHAMMAIINTMRENSDMPELPELPKAARFTAYSDEFAPVPNELEEEAYDYLGLTRRDDQAKTEGVVE